MAWQIGGNYTAGSSPRSGERQTRHIGGEPGKTVCGRTRRPGLWVVMNTEGNRRGTLCKRCQKRAAR